MKALIIGGRNQGKKQFAIDAFGIEISEIFYAGQDGYKEAINSKVIYAFHLLVKQWLELGLDTLSETEKLNAEIIICDEIGGGIVPLNPFERQWREDTGRCCCLLAQKAEKVVRVYCGLEQVIK